MKIGKYILAGLLMAAVILPASAQDKQYDVKLTVYPKEEQAKVKENKKAKKEREKTLRDEYRDYKKAERAELREERSMERIGPADPTPIKAAQSGTPYTSVRPVESSVSYVADGQKDPTEATVVVYEKEPARIESVYAEDPKQPVRPLESYDPVTPTCDKGECLGECGEGECCGKECDKPCCGDKPCCEKPCAGKPVCGPGPACQMTPCGMPIFGCNAQYRDFKKMMRNVPCNFCGDAFYLGTNALAYLVLAPNMSMEWRRDEKRGLRLSLGGMYWPWTGNDNGNDENTYGFWVTPEYRFYLGQKKAWYAGPMAQFGYLGRCYDQYTYYGGGSSRISERYMAISAGGSFGYMQKVKRNFAIDYNVSVGVSAVGHYDEANIDYYGNSGAETKWNAAFTPTNIGISLVWQTCSKPLKRK